MDDDLSLVLGCLNDQQATVRETVPGLMSAAVYADRLTVVAFEADTLYELSDFNSITHAFDGFFDYFGADSAYLPGNPLFDKGGEIGSEDDLDIESLEEALSVGDEADDWWIREERQQQYRYALTVAEIVSELIGSPNTIPLLYDPMGMFIDDAEALGKLSRPTKRKLEAGAKLGSGLVDRLPSFDTFSAQQIVEVRQEFRDYLDPFRSYVVETSSALAEVVRDEDAVADVVNEIYVGKVRPSIAAISDEMLRSSFGRSMLRNLAQDPKSFIQSFVTFGLGNLAELPLGVSLGAAAASQVTSTLSARSATRRRIRQDRLYLLHEISGAAGRG